MLASKLSISGVKAFSKGILYKNFHSINNDTYKVVIVGAGAAGLNTSSLLIKRKIFNASEIALIDPFEIHYYYSFLTLVGGGLKPQKNEDFLKNNKNFQRNIRDVIHPKVSLFNNNVKEIDLKFNKIHLSNNLELKYKYLILCPGIMPSFDNIKNSIMSMNNPNCNVSSIYYQLNAIKLNNLKNSFKGGDAIFVTNTPPTKCGGAPIKMCFILNDYFRKKGLNYNIKFYTPLESLFSVEEYSEKLFDLCDQRNIEVKTNHKILEIDPIKSQIIFSNNNKIINQHFDIAHITPEFFLHNDFHNFPFTQKKNSIEIDSTTFLVKNTNNVFCIGDAANLSVGKTASSISSQVPVLIRNITRLENNQSMDASFDGYSLCPVFTSLNQIILLESKFSTESAKSFFNKALKPRRIFAFFIKYMMPKIYWALFIKGKWFGKRFLFAPKFPK